MELSRFIDYILYQECGNLCQVLDLGALYKVQAVWQATALHIMME